MTSLPLSTRPRSGCVPITFLKYYDKGSTVMGGDQIASGLAERGWEARSLPISELDRLSPGILVFIKTSRIDHLLGAKARGHQLVLDVQDTVVFKRRIKNRWLFDALIFKSQRQLLDFGRPGSADRVIYHQWDPRYLFNRPPRDRLRVGYLGEPRSMRLWGEIPDVEFVRYDLFRQARRFNCHLSVREPGREFLYKPNCKVSTAAACGAVLLTTPDETSVELLGADYPYYCEAGLESIRGAIERARSSFGSPEWRLSLERLERVRELTRMERILDQYESLFVALGEMRAEA